MPMPHYTAIVTLLAVGFYFFTGIAVAKGQGEIWHKGSGHGRTPRF